MQKSRRSCGSTTKPKRLPTFMYRFSRILRLVTLSAMTKREQRHPEDQTDR